VYCSSHLGFSSLIQEDVSITGLALASVVSKAGGNMKLSVWTTERLADNRNA